MTFGSPKASMAGMTFGTEVLVAIFTEALDLDISPFGLLTGLTVGIVIFITGAGS